MKDAIVYVDFGGSHITAIAGVVQEDHALKMLGEQTHLGDEVKSGIVEKITGAAFKINEIIKLLQNSLKMEQIGSVSISVNAKTMKHYTHSIDRSIRGVVTAKLLKEMENECRQSVETDKITVFECIPLAYYVDERRVEDPLGQKGNELRIDFNVILGNYLVKETIERSIERTGIAVDYIHLGMEAIATAVLDDRDRHEGCGIIAFGATTTTLGVYCEGKLQELFVVPLGGLNITKDIQELGISAANAEKLKCKTGSALEKMVTNPVNVQIPAVNPNDAPVRISTSFLATIIEARLEEILEPVFEQINSIPYPLHSGVVITGGACKMKYLKEFIEEKTGFTVRTGDHSEWLSDDTDPKFLQPEYSQAVGAILLTNDYRRQAQQEMQEMQKAAIEVKIPRKNIISRARDKFNKGMLSLFEYDDIERKQNEKQ